MAPGGRPEQARRRRARALPLIVIAGVAFVAGAAVGAGGGSSDNGLARRFVGAWARGDYAAMYALLTPAARGAVDAPTFRRDYEQAAATATLIGLRGGSPRSGPHDAVIIPILLSTRVFGTLREPLSVPIGHQGSTTGVDWAPHLVFPGLSPGETLTRRTRLGARASILARDGRPLAAGTTRASAFGSAVTAVVGQLGPIPAAGREGFRALGYPKDAKIGSSGLEQAFEHQLAGTPGGTLMAGGRAVASAKSVPGHAVRTTIDPAIQQAAEASLSMLGGIAVLQPATGQVLALAGLATDTQPPGSTFKMVTTSAALEAHLVTLSSTFPVQDHSVLAGVTLGNASGETCGGTLLRAFADSCNSVFAPLGVRVGKAQLVRTAERYGFNQPPDLRGTPESTIPQPSKIGDDLDLGSTAIGQGNVVATPLEMALIAATIADGGRRPHLTFSADAAPRFVRAVNPRTAHLMTRMMLEVVRSGTGTSAQITGVAVAGKTGTAELEATQGPTATGGDNFTKTDAWFAAFAPAAKPRVAIGVLFVRAGAGGQTAAPVAHDVLLTALHRPL